MVVKEGKWDDKDNCCAAAQNKDPHQCCVVGGRNLFKAASTSIL